MPVEPERQLIYQFLHSHAMATIATVSAAGRPESALIAFAETDGLELLFETFVSSRKYKNLQHNPQVALVIGWDAAVHRSVQYEGYATLVPPHDIERSINLFLRKDTPCTTQFLHDPRARLFTVQPRWIRYADYTHTPPRTIERSWPITQKC